MKKELVTFCFITFSSSFVYAAQTAPTKAAVGGATTTKKSAIEKTPEKFSLKIELSADSNLQDEATSAYQESTSFYLEPAYQISKKSKIKMNVGIDQNRTGDQKTSLSNTTVTLARNPIYLKHGVDLNLSTFGVLPSNEEDRERATLRGGTGVAGSLVFIKSLSKTLLTTTFGISALKNYHEYTQNADLGANISHRVRNILNVDLSLTKRFTLSFYGYYQAGWTYDSIVHGTFRMDQSASYDLGNQFEISISHSNLGNAFRENNVESNVALYDEDGSTFSLGLTKIF